MYWNDNTYEFSKTSKKININMRCIEIKYNYYLDATGERLTLTWDVLKWCKCCGIVGYCRGLTLTWDVLKL